MKINEAGLSLIKSFESCKTKAYRDVVGIWTIGWGHTGVEVKDGLEWSQARCDEQLATDLAKFEQGVTTALLLQASPNQFAAMVAFAFNCGLGAFKSSTLLRCFNKRNTADAAEEFLKWCKAGGVVVPGLLRRRKAERELFLRD